MPSFVLRPVLKTMTLKMHLEASAAAQGEASNHFGRSARTYAKACNDAQVLSEGRAHRRPQGWCAG